ncbi:hypothetical protein TRFO_41624 [Tritrichomonas foetus]|uniref:Uncharacterized protein n=1 Tax=Tritrichomonas foetus TaxID=1144522 RepID=A0A1J4KZL4_9EUKA|nr:hypothetical protein TRFO_41624 [Tritrichomonas foetus]|eukprot:OHT16695.1 hypothetical protein TRFO_41624 [Tritrichomonas foetus]
MSKYGGNAADVQFILVKANEKGGSARRVLLTKNLPALKKACQSALKESEPVLSLLKEDGTPIQKFEEIVSGMTLIASTKEIKIQKEQQIGNVMSFAEIEALGFIGQTGMIDPSDMSLAQSMGMSPNSGSRVPSGKSSELVSTVSGGIRPSNSMSRVSATRVSGTRYSGTMSRTQRTIGGNSVFDESQMGRSTMSRRRPQQSAPTNIQLILNSLIPEDKSLADVDYMVRSCLEKDFLLNLTTFEENQRQYWFKNVLSQSLFDQYRKTDVYEETQKYATSNVEEHRFIAGRWVDYRLRMAIMGPKNSGKTTLLGEITKQYCCEIAYAGQWKNTFIFALDVKEIVPLFNDFRALLEYFVDVTIDAIVSQKPVLQKDLIHAKKTLKSICEVRASEIKLSSIGLLDEIALQLSTFWRDTDAAIPFLDYVLSLPFILSRAVGFEDIIWIMDNIDDADVQITPSNPFEGCDDFIYVIEHLKAILDNCNFIIACNDTDRFFQTMIPIDENGTDLLNGTTYITTTDVAEVDEEDIGDNFAIRIAGQQLPLMLNVQMCGGVVHYFHYWDELCHCYTNLETAKNDEQADKSLFELLAHAQDVVKLLYQFEGVEEVIVENVTRITFQ